MDKDKHRKNILIIFWHWEEGGSLNHKLVEIAKNTFEDEGHHVVVNDLKKMNYQPVMGYHDVVGKERKNGQCYTHFKQEAYGEGKITDDLKIEIEKIFAADLVIFQFPLVLNSWPAIVKGYVERSIFQGPHYEFETGEVFQKAKIAGKKALISVTCGAPEGVEDTGSLIWPLEYTLQFQGFDTLKSHIFYGATMVSQKIIDEYLVTYSERLKGIFNEKELEISLWRVKKPENDPQNGTESDIKN